MLAWLGKRWKNVTAINEANIFAPLQQRTINIKVVVLWRSYHAVGEFAQCLWGIALVVAVSAGGISSAKWHANDGQVSLNTSQIGNQFRVQQGFMANTGGNSFEVHI